MSQELKIGTEYYIDDIKQKGILKEIDELTVAFESNATPYAKSDDGLIRFNAKNGFVYIEVTAP